MKFVFSALMATIMTSAAFSATIVTVTGSAKYEKRGYNSTFNSLEQQGVQYDAMLEAIHVCTKRGLSNCAAKSAKIDYCNKIEDRNRTEGYNYNLCKATAIAIGIDHGQFELDRK